MDDRDGDCGPEVVQQRSVPPRLPVWVAGDVRLGHRRAIGYEDAPHGVLVVYTERSAAFDDRQRTIFANVGEIIGFAITAAERKDALVADSVLECSWEIRDQDQFFVRAATRLGATVTLEGITRRGGDEYLAYLTVTDASPGEIRDLADRSETIDHVRIVSVQRIGRVDCRVVMLSALQLSSTEKAAATTRLIEPVALVGDYPDLAVVPSASP